MFLSSFGSLYADPTSSEIYQISMEGNSYVKYRIDFAKWQWPEEKKYDFETFIKQKIGTISVLHNKVKESENVLVFNYQDKNKVRTGYYFKQIQKLYTYDNLKKGPFLELMIRSGPVGLSKGGYFINSLPADLIKNVLLKIEKSPDSVPPELYNIFTTENEEELNPVLLFYKFKGDI